MLRLTDGVPLDADIRGLCDAFTAAGCRTVYSCGAHLDARPPQPRAYVTFVCADLRWMGGLRTFLRTPPPELAQLERELRFDCFLGRYTASVWAPQHTAARTALDAGLYALTGWIRVQASAGPSMGPLCAVPAGDTPVMAVPCGMTLHAPPARCGWTGAPLGSVC